ncbi:hypothetical protein IscW_ISCW017458 [Ixodes scapularis]|uniref:Uncharacterized protein n=1 Tax=Ixodes scapularis TaxID=6945 RepID=B7PAR8_IXOSC|nr:hypothetical protein IscW_ISCW017458 [Ixodes scapularis]|eukprot:XP_002407134.1 hypothetical protein IscW_ISCW017458 [Ixodes scapularis]
MAPKAKAVARLLEANVRSAAGNSFRRWKTVAIHRIRMGRAITARVVYNIEFSTLEKRKCYVIPPDLGCQRCKVPGATPRLSREVWKGEAL